MTDIHKSDERFLVHKRPLDVPSLNTDDPGTNPTNNGIISRCSKGQIAGYSASSHL